VTVTKEVIPDLLASIALQRQPKPQGFGDYAGFP